MYYYQNIRIIVNYSQIKRLIYIIKLLGNPYIITLNIEPKYNLVYNY